MELIAKTVNAGKTLEAIEIARELEGNTLFVSYEETADIIASHLNSKPVVGKVICTNLTSAMSVKTALLGWNVRGMKFDTVVLDVNHVITHSEWFKLAMELEEAGYTVIGTQNLVKHNAKSKDTLIAHTSNRPVIK